MKRVCYAIALALGLSTLGLGVFASIGGASGVPTTVEDPFYDELPSAVPVLGPQGEVIGHVPKVCVRGDPNRPAPEECPRGEFGGGLRPRSEIERSTDKDGNVTETTTDEGGEKQVKRYRVDDEPEATR